MSEAFEIPHVGYFGENFEPPKGALEGEPLRRVISRMSDEELEALEDELDFADFAGAPGPRMVDILSTMSAHVKGWKARHLDAPLGPEVF